MGTGAMSATAVGMPAPPPFAAGLPTPASLPGDLADLAPLAEVGIAAPGAFALMGMASRAGHRLGNIVAATAAQIRRARHPFAYVRKLVCARRDWVAIAREKDQPAGDGDAPTPANLAARSGHQPAVRTMAAVLSAMATGVIYSHETVPYVWQRVDAVILQAQRDQIVDSAGGRVAMSLTDQHWMTLNRTASFVQDWECGKIQPLSGTAEVAPESKPEPEPEPAARPVDGHGVAEAFSDARSA